MSQNQTEVCQAVKFRETSMAPDLLLFPVLKNATLQRAWKAKPSDTILDNCDCILEIILKSASIVGSQKLYGHEQNLPRIAAVKGKIKVTSIMPSITHPMFCYRSHY